MKRIINFFKSSKESNKIVKWIELTALCILCICSIFSFYTGMTKIHSDAGKITYLDSMEMTRERDQEDYDEDYTVCDVTYRYKDQSMVISYSYEDYINLDRDTITAYKFKTDNGTILFFDHKDIS